MRMKFDVRRPIAVLMAAILFAIGLMPTGLGAKPLLSGEVYAGEIHALADNESFTSVSGGSSPFSVDTSWRHYRSDGALAYCRQKGLNNPDGTSGSYWIDAWEPGEWSLIAALFANADGVAASYGITGDDKRALIQMAIWAVESHFDSVNPSPGSVTSGNPTMLAAFGALYDVAMAGYSQQTASISGIANGDSLVGKAYGSTHVRYGPFSVSGSSSASASAADAPSGAYFGDGSGNAVNKDNLANGQQFYLYIPFGSGSAKVPKITVWARYSTITVSKYSGFAGVQDQIVGGDPGSAEISVSATALGFGKAAVWKHDEEDSAAALSDAAFAVDEWSNSANNWKASGVPVAWNAGTRRYETGTLIETADNGGRFRIRETTAPYSYLSGWSEEINIHSQYATCFAIGATDTPVKLRINLVKNDRNTGNAVPQGDAKLSGAKYGLYMNEDREHPNGTLYRKDQKIAEAVTDGSGEIVFENLFPALYYIKELSPSEGYLLDAAVYEIDGRHDGVAKSVVRNISVTEQVKKQKFELVKIGTSEAATEVSLLNAGFKVYLISELSGVRSGNLVPSSGDWSYKDFKGYDFTGEPTAMIDGVNTPEFFTDSLGHFVSPEFPYGKYVVVESTTPESYLTINPFIVTVAEDSRAAQPWRIFDDKELKYYIRVIKKDAETGNTVLGKTAKYRIFDLEANEYIKMKTTYPQIVWHGTEENPFATDESGTLITPEKLKYGHYRLDEVTAPEGYVLAGHEQSEVGGYNPDGKTAPNPSEPVYVEFANQTPVYIADAEDDVIEVIQFNEQQKGKLSLEKRGGKPQSVTTDKDGNMVFGYRSEPLDGVVFQIIADGDIVSQDGSGIVLFKDGEVVSEITTDGDGHAWDDGLFIGEYILREVYAPDGYLFVDDEHFSVTQIEQERQFTFFAYGLTDNRQKLNVEILKTEEENGKPVPDAEFSLYAAEDIVFGDPGGSEEGFFSGIVSLITDNVPFNLIEKDALVATAITGEDGKAVFADLPSGAYYVTETKAPSGYLLNKDFKAEFTLAYDGHETETLTSSAECSDIRQKLNIEIVKKDAASGENLSGGEFTLADFWGKVIATAVTGEDGVARFSDLPEGTYRVKETKAPAGYQINKDFHPTFKLEYDADGTEILKWSGVCSDEKAPVPATPAPRVASIPKTGDGFNPMLIVILLLSAAGISGLLIYRKRTASVK